MAHYQFVTIHGNPAPVPIFMGLIADSFLPFDQKFHYERKNERDSSTMTLIHIN